MFEGLLGKSPRVRMPPSPTGNIHIGNIRTCLFNSLFARKHGGVTILRIEDTDRARSRPEFEQNIIESLTWLGIGWDEFYRQSERLETHQRALKKLIDADKAYISKEASKMNEGEMAEVIRLRNPGTTITFNDIVRGDVTIDTADLGDFVIARSIDDPLYHLAVVVDDGEMGVTHVLRGEDHISNTPRQILLLEALGFERPIYAHMPLILAPDRSKLSKRHGAVSLSEYKAMGFIPEAINNYLALLGWNPGTEQEIFSTEELIDAFTLEKLQKGGAIFDMTRFTWFNREHLKRMPQEEFLSRLSAFTGTSVDPKLGPLLQERANTLKEGEAELLELQFLSAQPIYDAALLVPKTKSGNETKETTRTRLDEVVKLLEPISASQFTLDAVKEAVWEYAEKEGKGAVLWPMRVALTGKEKSPDPFTVAALLGRDETVSRLKAGSSLLL